MTTDSNHIGGLLSRTALGDRRAFEELYRATSSKLLGLLMRILKREDLAQECLQDAYVLIWNRAGDYRADKAAPITWMASIARYRALDLLRKRKHEVSVDDEVLSQVPDEHQVKFDDQLVEIEDAQGLEECMKTLNINQRNCIYMAYFDGYTHPEIAMRIDAPVGSVKTWIRRGMMSLKECLS